MKRYKIMILTATCVFVICIGCFIGVNYFSKKTLIHKMNNYTFAFTYDSSWKITEKKNDSIVLKHSSGGIITIQKTALDEKVKYSSIDELIDEVLFHIQNENPDYRLINKEKAKITKYQFDGYQLLYEKDNVQVMMYFYKKGDQLLSIQYEASSDVFDILLDSVQSIVYDFDSKDEKFDYQTNIKIDTKKITFSNNSQLDSLLGETKEYEIMHNHYYVKYAIPSIFQLYSFDTTVGSFGVNFDNGWIQITTSVMNKNLYEYLDKEDNNGLYHNYSSYRNQKEYSDFQESIQKIDSNYVSYLYKNSYTSIKKIENVDFIYSLDNNHIFIVHVNSSGVSITEKFVRLIQVIKSKNYASYITGEKEGNYLLSTLKRYPIFERKTIESIQIKVPDIYQEIDKNLNLYETRCYGYQYNDEIQDYDYLVRYSLSSLSIDKIVDMINSSSVNTTIGDYQYLTYSNEMNVNDKQFIVYDAFYPKYSGIMYMMNRKKYLVKKKVLIYSMPSKGNLYIEIDGNGKDITDEMIHELVNFMVSNTNIE